MEENKKENQKKEGFFQKVKRKVAETGDKVLGFMVENPQFTLPFLSGLGMFVAGGGKWLASAERRMAEKCRVHDDVTEEYFMTKHPLTNEEILELGERMIDGQPKGYALDEMGLLRKEKKRK